MVQRSCPVPFDCFSSPSAGARGGGRTHTPLRGRDFKSLASAISPPGHLCGYTCVSINAINTFMRLSCCKLSASALWCLICLDGHKPIIKPTVIFVGCAFILGRDYAPKTLWHKTQKIPRLTPKRGGTKNPQPEMGRWRWRLPPIWRTVYAVAASGWSYRIPSRIQANHAINPRRRSPRR